MAHEMDNDVRSDVFLKDSGTVVRASWMVVKVALLAASGAVQNNSLFDFRHSYYWVFLFS